MMSWLVYAATGSAVVSAGAAIAAAWYSRESLNLAKIAYLPAPEVRPAHGGRFRISVPEGGEFKISQISMGKTPGSIQASRHLGVDPSTDISLFEDSGRPGRAVNVTPPSTAVWFHIETSAPLPTLETKIISDRFNSVTIPITLYTK
ncbi:hypothetical protein [Aerobium aerolatum]|uniref:hypothetical protein n=1 Tax=Aerobium aerolatum TaxID=561088 RepID=UPI001113F690|nr:hypothetical protein [Aquamicrobium aerolatum]